jgi:hypothetical protein
MTARQMSTGTEALKAIAYSAYDRILGLEPLDWEARLKETPEPAQDVRDVPLDFPIEQVAGCYEHPAYGLLTARSNGDKLADGRPAPGWAQV